MASMCRALDLLLVACFFVFAMIALTIDFTQAFYGKLDNLEASPNVWWPSPTVIQYYKWWCKEVDVLLGANPLWYQILAVFSPLIYIPYYIAAIYAFLNKKEWIRVPTLMWGWGLLLTMVPIVAEQTVGEHAAKDLKMFWIAYGMYIVVPLVAMLRVAFLPVFATSAERVRVMATWCDQVPWCQQRTKRAMGGNVKFQDSLKARLDIVNPTVQNIKDFNEKHAMHNYLTPKVEDFMKLLMKMS